MATASSRDPFESSGPGRWRAHRCRQERDRPAPGCLARCRGLAGRRGLVVGVGAVHGHHGEDPPHPEPQFLRGKAGQRTPEGRQVAIADRVLGRAGPAAHLLGRVAEDGHDQPGSPGTADPDAVRAMIRLMRGNLAAMPARPVPRGFAALQTLPEGLLAAMLRRFLRSSTAAHSGLSNATPAAEAAELERVAEQMRAYARVR